MRCNDRTTHAWLQMSTEEYAQQLSEGSSADASDDNGPRNARKVLEVIQAAAAAGSAAQPTGSSWNPFKRA